MPVWFSFFAIFNLQTTEQTFVMKQFFAACALMLGIVSLGVAQEVVTGPAIALDKDVHDYGTIQQGDN